ncbi:MAG: glycosyltransferase [Proteobacteria bacterium]|nr:glycosyltransferase [Pseudomonadota bacterium]
MAPTAQENPRVAVLLPCYNEAATVEKCVRDFREALPHAVVYVFDNNSTDDTGALAAAAGAEVVRSARQGKGHVVQHMFRVIDADIYVMADGDDTYPAADAPRLIQELAVHHADMLVGSRLQDHEGNDSFRPLHVLGNGMFVSLVNLLFRVKLRDILSGYRVFSRRFVDTIPLSAGGFGIETDMTLNALSKGMYIIEVPIHYGSRPEGSESKLDTWRDGVVILTAIVRLFKDYKPLMFFGGLALLFGFLSLLSGSAPVLDYIRTGLVGRFPLAILAASLGVLSALMFSVGLILDTAARYHREVFFALAHQGRSGMDDPT